MNAFEEFLMSNGIKKKDVAKFLNVGASTITYYCKEGSVPDFHIAKMSQVWDVAPLREVRSVGPAGKAVQADALLSEIEMLKQIVNNQSMIIAQYKTMLDRFMREIGNEG